MTAHGQFHLESIGLAAAGIAALLVVYYAAVTLRPNPVAKPRLAHEARGRELGFLQPDMATPSRAAIPPADPAPVSPRFDLWQELRAGLSGGLGAVATYTFQAPGDEDAALAAIRTRSLLQPAIMSRMAAPPAVPWASDTAQAEARRAEFEALLAEESAIAQDDSIPLTGHSDRVAAIVAYLALHGESTGARKVLDRFLERALEDPRFYLNLSEFPWGNPEVRVPSLLSTAEPNPIASVAVLLDQAAVEVACLDRIAEALEQEIPPPEKRAWMMEQSQYAAFAVGEASLDTAMANLRPTAVRSLPGGQYLDGFFAKVRMPLLKAYYRDSFAAWMRGDIPTAVGAGKRFALLRAGMGLYYIEAIGQALPFPPDVEIAAWRRAQVVPPRHMIQVETARFVVAAIRFRRAEGRWPEGTDELVPKWLPAGSIDGPGIRWGVMDLPSLEIHSDPDEVRLQRLVEELERSGGPPESLGVIKSEPGNLHLGNRPMFWRVGPADISSPYLSLAFHAAARASAMNQPPVAPPAVEEFRDDAGIWREARGFTMLRVPGAAALQLLAPKNEGQAARGDLPR